jgi:hypothetical protein
MSKETVRKVLLKDLRMNKLTAKPEPENLTSEPTMNSTSPEKEKGNQITNNELPDKSRS